MSAIATVVSVRVCTAPHCGVKCYHTTCKHPITCSVSYNCDLLKVTSGGGGGMVSARDFVYVSKKGYHGNVFVMGGKSVEFKDAPTSGKIVR